MKLKNIVLSAVAVSALMLGSAANATTYNFGSNLSNNAPPLFAHFADLTVTDSDTDGNWEFTLDVFGLDLIGSSAFVSGVFVDFGFGHEPTGTSAHSGPADMTFDDTGSPYDYAFRFETSNKDGGIHRLTDGEVFSWVGDGMGTLADFAPGQVLIHVQGIGDADESDWYVSPVPEPETYAMLLAGLGLLGFSLRKQKQ